MKHALVTGGGRGIGAAIATALAADGARITVLGRDGAVLERHAATLPRSARALALVADVTDEAAIEAACEAARARHGAIDVLINNAGAALARPFTKMDRAAWDAMLAVNLTGTYVCCRTVVPDMLGTGGGRIVNIASTAGLAGGPYITAYAAAKHGVVGLTRALASELASHAITVNAVCPGYTRTAMLERSLDEIVSATGRTREAAAAALLGRNPLGRFVRPEEVAETVAWLCGPAAGAITGQAIGVDGGEVAR
ncbi:MAG: SDR family oxidoreductase [Candidatus Eremiobacteraeota bacterium]|nr:SDR family oxidoreductase [Candidatus Eremiobacteraeota bacterium]MBC5803657.1 SDR family oxidoreductase [Candidatus Eremiobacteraeota bacterium]MBC5822333.1 SDR family oxidoreductase [Candidatus Eremiobacteraeota bacterium]